ncbi:MAG TPA: UDP-N-acetylmuramate dehydrogenase [Thermoanaerobaculia bacterium]|jgi:UDP-N-acetylmuramate dehydrogenase
MIPDALRSPGVAAREGEPLAARTTLRIGGPARLFVEVADADALARVLRFASAERLPILVLGKGSNLLVPDAGFPGVVIVLAGSFRETRVEGSEVVAGGGVSLMALAVAARDAGLSGVENVSGIPSSVGGAVRINAGSYGSEIFDVLVSATLVSPAGEVRTAAAATVAHGYRWTSLCETGDVVGEARFRLTSKPPAEIAARMAEVAARRRDALPKQPNAGSIFKNPPGRFAGMLLEECGLKGRRVGGAEISRVHANVIVNTGGATAEDVRRLMEDMKAAVRERFGVELQPEIQIVAAQEIS